MLLKCYSTNKRNLRWASLDSFCDVWWIAKPIREALLLNSDWFAAADLGSSLLLPPPPYGTLFSAAGAIDLLRLSTIPKNSSVRSRYDDCPCLACILFVREETPDLGSHRCKINRRLKQSINGIFPDLNFNRATVCLWFSESWKNKQREGNELNPINASA